MKEAENPEEARRLYEEAWNEAATNIEKCIAAHYLARLQANTQDKLAWDEQALSFALLEKSEMTKPYLPSLYLNIGKCYEDMGQTSLARHNYNKAVEHLSSLPDDPYGKMTVAGVEAAIKRCIDKE